MTKDTNEKSLREQCIIGTLEGLERARVSLNLWARCAQNQIEKTTMETMLSQVETLIKYVSTARMS